MNWIVDAIEVGEATGIKPPPWWKRDDRVWGRRDVVAWILGGQGWQAVISGCQLAEGSGLGMGRGEARALKAAEAPVTAQAPL